MELDFDGADSRYLNPLQQVTRDVQCDIICVEDQVRFVSLHNQQLLLYREQLDLLQGDLARSQQQESLFRGQLGQAAEELAILQYERQEAAQREEALLRQTQELVEVVDEQTRQLRDKDAELKSHSRSDFALFPPGSTG